jgi:hypothetical protein
MSKRTADQRAGLGGFYLFHCIRAAAQAIACRSIRASHQALNVNAARSKVAAAAEVASASEFVLEAIDRFLSLVSFTGEVFGVDIDCGPAVRAGDAILRFEPTDAFTHFVAALSAVKVDGPIVDGSHDDLQLGMGQGCHAAGSKVESGAVA